MDNESGGAGPGTADDIPEPLPFPSLEEMQHWTSVFGRAQQMLMEYALGDFDARPWERLVQQWMAPEAMSRWTTMWADGIALWQQLASAGFEAMAGAAPQPAPRPPARDRRFDDPAWQDNPLFVFIRQSYEFIADHMLRTVDAVEGLDSKQEQQLKFMTRGFIDAMSPTNFVWTNPRVIERTLETRGENLLRGLENMLADLRAGQVTHTDREAFELGRNIAVTPGKVVYETPLFQLIQYAPATDKVQTVPLLIFPPWINRFYILDLNPAKSFVRYCVEQGFTTYMISWKSADASMSGLFMADYIQAQSDAIDAVLEMLKVKETHVIGYCVAGTTLAATLAWLTAKGEADKVKSATFFTAQVDFSEAGDLSLFVDDRQLALIEAMSGEGFLDGRYMAATFNLLRGRDLIWNYVVNNYLLGEDYPIFDLLYWNGDTTNLSATWHKQYLEMLYRDNLMARPGGISIKGIPIDLTTIKTPVYIQAGREDHIAPARSVWKALAHFAGPKTFILAGSGHIAGVVNPPAAGKYQYWTNSKAAKSLDAFIAGAKEHPGSWWPHWAAWLKKQAPATVAASGARMPGKGKFKAIEDAPGRYVKMR